MLRQLEFALLCLNQQLDELFNAVQYVMQGKLPMTLINPTVLQNILRNVSLQLPEGYELIAGVMTENICLYYELVKVSIATIPHCIRLIISVPLKTANYYFTLYKVVTLPERMSYNKFVQYIVNYPYFGLHNNECDILFAEEYFNHCIQSSIVVCPVYSAIYNVQTMTI